MIYYHRHGFSLSRKCGRQKAVPYHILVSSVLDIYQTCEATVQYPGSKCALDYVRHRGTKGILLFFFKRPERYNQEVLSHSFICLPLPYICDAARVWGRPKATKHTKNASYRGGRAADLIVLTIPQPKAVAAYGLCGPAQAKRINYEKDKCTLTVTSGR